MSFAPRMRSLRAPRMWCDDDDDDWDCPCPTPPSGPSLGEQALIGMLSSAAGALVEQVGTGVREYLKRRHAEKHAHLYRDTEDGEGE